MSKANPHQKVCFIPRLQGLGGPSSFQAKLAAGLRKHGVETTYHLDDPDCSTLLVTGGSMRLDQIWRARQRGLRIIQRLDGMNWVHRIRRTGLRHYLRSEINNRNLALIRARLADRIVYQSQFSKSWWERVYGPLPKPDTVIYNGVDLSIYTPLGPAQLPKERLRLQLVEGHLGGGNEAGLQNAVQLAQALLQKHHLEVELFVVGDVPSRLRSLENELPPGHLVWAGVLPRERVPQADRSAHLLFSADTNPACPNAVIEALACGLPVVAFDTGALPELVQGGAGEVVPYGGNPWALDQPDISALAAAAARMLDNLSSYRQAARARAEASFALEHMTQEYLQFFQ